jgi:hypothetical protein
MIQAFVFPRSLNGEQRDGLFHHQDSRAIPPRIGAETADFFFGNIVAPPAESEPFLHVDNGLRQATGLFRGHLEQKKSQPLRRLPADPRQPFKLIDQTIKYVLRHPFHGRKSPERI